MYNVEVVRSVMKAPRKTTPLVVVLAALVVLFYFVSLQKTDTGAPDAKPNLIAEQKAQIITIVSSTKPLTDGERDTLFSSLSGPKMLQYYFTESEKNMIVRAINAANISSESPKKGSSSSARSYSFSEKPKLYVMLDQR